MAWERKSVMSQRVDFVRLVEQLDNMAEACRRAGISRPTGYKWWRRYEKEGLDGLTDRSRRPHTSPNRTPEAMERAVLRVRDEKKGAWGGRKIHHHLVRTGHKQVPAPSTITAILKRTGRIDPDESDKHRAFKRFEKNNPNELWQMDFKGHFAVEQGRCHPLTILDDHSRYSVGLKACLNERRTTVVGHLKSVFGRVGLPEQIIVDNGAPWGHDWEHRCTRLTVWLMELGIRVSHSRPRHPQTLGKDERFHRTFKQAVQPECEHQPIEACQPVFDDWRTEYNQHRPHQALEHDVPAQRYRPSERSYPQPSRPWTYSTAMAVRKVDQNGKLSFESQSYRVGKGLAGQSVGLRPLDNETIEVYFRQFKVNNLKRQTDSGA